MKKIIATVISLLLILSLSIPASASESTSYTYTLSVNGDWIRTQDAYMPGNIFLNNGTLKAPEDLFYKDNLLYIADTGNGRVICYDYGADKYNEIAAGTFTEPCGLYVTDDAIYVADRGAKCVFKVDFSGKILLKITRPDSYLFSKQSQYIPVGVAVTSQGVIFVCGEGSYEGLLQFDAQGNFQGFYAANSTTMSFSDRLKEMIFSEGQMRQLLNRIPNPITNIDISDEDLVYSITKLEATTLWSVASKSENAVKYHNMSGKDILSKDLIMDEHNFTDIAAYKNGLSIAVTSTGLIYEYDDSGDVIFSFGGRATSERSGHFSSASAVDIDDNGIIYILDKEHNYIQLFFPTDFAVSTHEALYSLSKGGYDKSEEIWLSLLRLNGMSLTAHRGYGKLLYRQQRFFEAAQQFKFTKDTANYSQCIWEMRNIWFKDNLIWIIALICLLVIAEYLLVFLKKKGIIKKKSNDNPIIKEAKFQLSAMGGILKNPFDEFYYLKHKQHGSVYSATVILFLTFAVYLFDMLGRSFTFRLFDTDSVFPISLVIMFVVPVALLVVGNFMISAICEGEGNIRDIYIATSYSFVPYLVIAPIMIALTYVLTLNEAIIIQLLWTVAIGWSAVLLVMSVKEIHNYSVKETVKVILLTLFFMIMAVIVLVIIYLIIMQVVVFVKDIASEVSYRAAT